MFTKLITIFFACLIFCQAALAQEQVKIGVVTTLTGDAAAFGTDVRNALEFANEKFMHNKYKLIFEDDQCSVKGAVTAAEKLASINGVKYVLGIVCNDALVGAAPVYVKNKITAISTGASSGDKLDIGPGIFRLFPADQFAAELLYDYILKKHKTFGLYTEQNEYTVMMQNTFVHRNEGKNNPLKLTVEEWNPGNTDHRAIVARFKKSGVEGLFLNSVSEATFAQAFKQFRNAGFSAPIYGVYYPGSNVTITALGKLANGIEFANLPLIENALTPEGQKIYSEYLSKYGKPGSISLMVAFAIDSLRMLDQGLASGEDLNQFFHNINYDGLIGKLSFDKYGAIQGLNFEMQKIVDGKIEIIH